MTEPTASSSDKHPGYATCPGCGRLILAHLLACRRCWAALPRINRERVGRAHGKDALVLASAIVEAVSWLRRTSASRARARGTGEV